jgi:hypothetical protein
MVSKERAEEILKIFETEPRDIARPVVARKLKNEELEYLLNHLDASAEVKDGIRQELARRRATQTPGRMPELIRFFEHNQEQLGNPVVTGHNRAFDLTWNAEHKLALRWSWQDMLGIDLLPENESLIFCALIWEPEFHIELEDSSHRFLYVNAALKDFHRKIEGPYPYTNKIGNCKTQEGKFVKSAFEAGLDYLEDLG